MPSIEISRKHARPLADARKAIERLAKSIAKRFDVEYEWQGDTLRFQRPGVHGQIVLAKSSVRVAAHLNFLLVALKPAIEAEIVKQLEKEFD